MTTGMKISPRRTKPRSAAASTASASSAKIRARSLPCTPMVPANSGTKAALKAPSANKLRNRAGTRVGGVGGGGRMGRMLAAEIVASEGCTLAGGCARPGSGCVNQDIGELAGIGRLGIAVGDNAERVIRDSDVVIDFTAPA